MLTLLPTAADRAAETAIRGLGAVLAAGDRSLTRNQRADRDAGRDARVLARLLGDDDMTTPTIDRLRTQRADTIDAVYGLMDQAETEGRDLTDAETAEAQRLHRVAKTRSAHIVELRQLEQRKAVAATVPSQSQPGQSLSAVVGQRIEGGRYNVYQPDPGGPSYFRDIISAGRGDADAADRLRRNDQLSERRDGTTGATSMGSFIPPRWLLDQTAELARAGRILAGLVEPGGEPTSTSMTIPRVTTGSSVASQATENAAVSETDIVTAQLTRSTVTIAGQQDVSIQSVELATPMTDRLLFSDLIAAYQAELDRQILRGSGASGELLGINQVSGINAVTYTDATPTVPELYPKVADAIQQAAVGRKLAPTAIVMHPRRWAWITASLDTSNRPLVVPAGGAFNAAATFASAAREGRVGELQGLPVYSDSNVATNLGAGTNEDQIVVFHGPSIVLYESAIRTRVLADVLSANLTLRYQVYAHANLFAGRYPTSISTVGGNSLITPAF